MTRQSTVEDKAALAVIKRRLIDACRRCSQPHGRNSAYAGVRFEFASPAEGAAALLCKLGPIPPGMSLDRIDPRGPYSLDNLRYATPTLQSLNRTTVLNSRRAKLLQNQPRKAT
jgi:hypothetical protein